MSIKTALIRDDQSWISEVHGWKESLRSQTGYLSNTFTMKGLNEAMYTAMAMLEATGVELPHNFWEPQGCWRKTPTEKQKERFLNRPRNRDGKGYVYGLIGGMDPVEETVRMAGWMRKASEMDEDGKVKLPYLVYFLKKTLTSRGINSPHCHLHLQRFIRNTRSPGRAQHKLFQIKIRANRILKPYGLKVSWASLGSVCSTGLVNRPGKAARKAAAMTISFFISKKKLNSLDFEKKEDGTWRRGRDCEILAKARGLKELKDADMAIIKWAMEKVSSGQFSCIREALEKANHELHPDATDGVRGWIELKEGQKIHGITVEKLWTEDGAQWLVFGFGRTFHFSGYSYQFKGEGPKVAVQEALVAWKKRKEIEKMESEFLAQLRPEGFCPIVWREDSFRAGNCRYGTESWLRKKGLFEQAFVRVDALVPHMENPLVRNVLKTVANQLALMTA